MALETGRHHFQEGQIPDPRPKTAAEFLAMQAAGATLSGQNAIFEANRIRATEADLERAIETKPNVIEHGLFKKLPVVVAAVKEYMRRFSTESGKHRPERIQRRSLVHQMA